MTEVVIVWDGSLEHGVGFRLDAGASRLLKLVTDSDRSAATTLTADRDGTVMALVLSIGDGWERSNVAALERGAVSDLLWEAHGVDRDGLPPQDGTERGALAVDGERRACTWTKGRGVRWTAVDHPRVGLSRVVVAMASDD